MDILRRDDAGDEDFTVRVEIIEDPSLPTRARLLALDVQDELAAALVTRGLPKRSERRLDLGGLSMSFTYTGESVHIHDYLDDYKTERGYNPFFIQRGEGRFVTAPEDGALIELEPGDHIIVGDVLYTLQKASVYDSVSPASAARSVARTASALYSGQPSGVGSNTSGLAVKCVSRRV